MDSTLRLVRRHRERLWPLFTVCLVAGVVFLFQNGTFGERPCPMDGIFLTDAPDDWLLQRDDRNGCQWILYVDGRPAAADLYDDLPAGVGVDPPRLLPRRTAVVVVAVSVLGLALLTADGRSHRRAEGDRNG